MALGFGHSNRLFIKARQKCRAEFFERDFWRMQCSLLLRPTKVKFLEALGSLINSLFSDHTLVSNSEIRHDIAGDSWAQQRPQKLWVKLLLTREW